MARKQGDAESAEGRRGETDELSAAVIGAAIEVHRALGPGLLESAYQTCFCQELRLRQIAFESEVALTVNYKGLNIANAFRLDLLVEKQIAVELKAVEHIEPVHKAQLLSYLRLSHLPTGLLINFNVPKLIDGVRRLSNSHP